MRVCTACLASLVCIVPLSVAAQSAGDNEIGVRGALMLSDGEPANDITGFGVLFRHHLDDGWAWGVAIDANAFDFEQPARLIGITQDAALEAIDAKAETTDVSLFLERHAAWNERWSWFWQAGVGYGSVDVPRISGPRADGGTFQIDTDAGNEGFVLGGLGLKRHFGRWDLEGALTSQYRFADYKFRDSVSGQSGSVDDYLTYGLYVAAVFRF